MLIFVSTCLTLSQTLEPIICPNCLRSWKYCTSIFCFMNLVLSNSNNIQYWRGSPQKYSIVKSHKLLVWKHPGEPLFFIFLALMVSVFLLLVIPACCLVVSVHSGVPFHLRRHVKQCFVVSQTVLSFGLHFCLGLEQTPSPICKPPALPSVTSAGPCWPHINVFHFLWMLPTSVRLALILFPAIWRTDCGCRITWYSSAQLGSAWLSIEKRGVL